MSNLTGVTNFFPTPNEGFLTALNTSISSGATTVPLQSVSGLTDGSVFVGMIEPAGTNQQVFTGTVSVSGVQIINVVWTRGTNVGHSGGVTIVDYVTGTAINMISHGVLQQHTQTGAHIGVSNTGGLTTDTLHVTGATTLSGSGDIRAIDLSTSAILLGKASVTTTGTTSSVGSGAVAMTGSPTLTVTVPAGGRSVELMVMLSGYSVGNSGEWDLELWNGTVGSGTQLTYSRVTLGSAGVAENTLLVPFIHTPSAGSITYNIGVAFQGGGTSFITTAPSSTQPFLIWAKLV